MNAHTKGGYTLTVYFLEDGFLLQLFTAVNPWAINCNINEGKVIKTDGSIIGSFSADGSSFIGSDGTELRRNSAKKFSYNCSLDETLGIYKNAYYLNSTEEGPICVQNSDDEYRIRYSMSDGGCYMDISGITTKDEFTAKLAEYNMSISDDGKEITYKGKIYTLMEK